MPRTASPLTLATTAGLGAGLVAWAALGLGAGHAETLAPRALPAFAPIAAPAPSAMAPAARQDEQRPARVARVVYPSHYTSQR